MTKLTHTASRSVSPFHFFKISIKEPHTTWKEKVFNLVEAKKLLHNPSLLVLERLLKTHLHYEVWVHPKDEENSTHENTEEKNIDIITKWELMFEILNVRIEDAKKGEYVGYSFYNEIDESIEICLGSGSKAEINSLLKEIALELPN